MERENTEAGWDILPYRNGIPVAREFVEELAGVRIP